ncbi:MAG TPA: sigma 54-interacting transcriptional regulator [Polyangiaceae bacterium]|nr:sigma 54-interacting transcriptional regulator [Polyangiaceae bacterium]
MSGSVFVWPAQGFAPSGVGDRAAGGVLALDRDLLGVTDGSVSRAANAPKLKLGESTEALLSVPEDSGATALVFEGLRFAHLQQGVAPAEERWKLSPGQLNAVGTLVTTPSASLALMQELHWDRPGASHHLRLLPPAYRVERGHSASVRTPAIILVGTGAVEVTLDITQAGNGATGEIPRAIKPSAPYAVKLPEYQFHSGLVAALDAFFSEDPPGLLWVPQAKRALRVDELSVPCGECLHRMGRTSAFLPVLEDETQLRLAFAYTRGDGTIGVALSDPEIRTWLTDIAAVLQARSRSVQRPSAGPPAVAPAEVCASFGNIDTRSAAFARTLKHVNIFARGDADLILLGETGTGKEHLAQALHAASSRSDGPFVAVNCAVETADLIESNLFGHERGAFTGAVAARKGKFREAEGGTLLLDEVGDCSLKFQLALLRVLETRRISPVGGGGEQAVNVRVISATSRNLKQLLDEGKFREDLYYRLRGGEITLPPLRERLEDLPDLCDTLLLKAPVPAVLHPSALEALGRYAWPGNVRELLKVLQAAAQSALVAAEHELRAGESVTILPEHLDLPRAPDEWREAQAPAYSFIPEIKALAAVIWSQQKLPPDVGHNQYKRRALLRGALLYLDTQTPRATWPSRLLALWRKLFGPQWASTEEGRGLRELVAVLAVNDREGEVQQWVLGRVGDAPSVG